MVSLVSPATTSAPIAADRRYRFRLLRAAAIDDRVLGSLAHSINPHLPRLVGMGSKLIGCGSAAPKFLISNDDLAQIVDTSDEWISQRTGIRNRRILIGDETLTSLSVEAAKTALEMAEVEEDNVDLVIMCTSTPDDLFGGGDQIQRDLGCRNAWAFDITAACSGFLVGVLTATRFIKGGGYQNILVIGADVFQDMWTGQTEAHAFFLVMLLVL